MSELQEVLRRLPGLSRDELKQVELRLQVLGQFHKHDAATNQNPTEDWLLDGIFVELERRGICGRAPDSRVRDLAPGYYAESKSVRAELLRSFGGSPTSRIKRAYGAACARALIEYLSAGPGPLNLSRLLMNIGKVPEALDASFPDYRASGLLHLIVATAELARGAQENGG
jgi:hypothetical protein